MKLLTSALLIVLSNIGFTNGLGYDNAGCFPKSAISGLSSQGSYQWQSSGYCEGLCLGNLVIAMNSGTDCYCGSALDKSAQVSSSFCSEPCSGYPEESCGSSNDQYFQIFLDAELNAADTSSSSSSTSTTRATTTTTSSSSSSSTTSTSSTSTTSSSSSTSSTAPETTSSSSTTSPTPTTTTSVLMTTETSESTEQSEVTTVMSSESVFTSNQELITVVHSVTSISIQIQTATAIRTATVAPTLTNNSNGNNSDSNNDDLGNRKNSSSSSLSHGAIAGIVIGVVVGTLLISGFLLWFFGVTLFCIPGRNREFDDYDDEKSLRDDSISLHRPVADSAALAGLEGFGRTAAYNYNADEISIGYGNRRFSQGSLPDAAGGSESDASNKAGGLRVINPDI